VLVISGIWPPDVGGPASNSPEVAAFLHARGHEVAALTTAAQPPAPEPYPVRWVSRALPPGLRHLRFAVEVAKLGRRADVAFTASVLGRTVLGALPVGLPYVVKLPGDPAYERAQRRGLFVGDLDAFQREPGGIAVRLLRAARDFQLSRAAHIVCPSSYLARLVVSWGLAPERVSVLPNPTPPVPALRPRDVLRAELGLTGPTLAFAGRLTAAKALGTALDAVARQPHVALLIAGDGEERAGLERRSAEFGLGDRVRFLGVQPRERVLELFAAADASILSSAWENFPHSVVEALAVGTPVIATSVGGVAEVVRDGEPAALAEAIGRFFADPALRARLRAAAIPSVERFAPERIYGQLEAILAKATRQ